MAVLVYTNEGAAIWVTFANIGQLFFSGKFHQAAFAAFWKGPLRLISYLQYLMKSIYVDSRIRIDVYCFVIIS